MKRNDSELISNDAWDDLIELGTEAAYTPYTVFPNFLNISATEALKKQIETQRGRNYQAHQSLLYHDAFKDLHSQLKRAFRHCQPNRERAIDVQPSTVMNDTNEGSYLQRPGVATGTQILMHLGLWEPDADATEGLPTSWRLRVWPSLRTLLPGTILGEPLHRSIVAGEDHEDIPTPPGTLVIIGGLAVNSEHGSHSVPFQPLRPIYAANTFCLAVKLTLTDYRRPPKPMASVRLTLATTEPGSR